jgi:hypothetical protein
MAPKPLVTFWSKAAIDEAGDSLMHIQRTVRLECGEIAGEAREWFLHIVRPEGGAAYLCNGRNEGPAWHVSIQLAEFESMDPLPEDHPDPERRGQVLKMPRAVETPENDIFAEIGYLEH